MKPDIFSEARSEGARIYSRELADRAARRKAKQEAKKTKENDAARALVSVEGLENELQLLFGKLREGGLSVKTRIVKSFKLNNPPLHNGRPISAEYVSKEKNHEAYYKKIVALSITISSKETTKILKVSIVPSLRTHYDPNFFYQLCEEYEFSKGRYAIYDCGNTEQGCINRLETSVVDYLAKIEARKLARKKAKKN
jgi:hypothetical protein